jgi:hypothetical protein
MLTYTRKIIFGCCFSLEYLADTDAPTMVPGVSGTPTLAPVIETSEPTTAPIIGSVPPTTSLAPVVVSVPPTTSLAPVVVSVPPTISLAPVVGSVLPTVTPQMDTAEPSVAPVGPGTDPPVVGSDAPSATPGAQPNVVIIQRFFIGYVNPGSPEPTAAQYDDVLNATSSFLNTRFTTYFTETRSDIDFLGVNASILSTLFENPPASVDAKFNIVINYDFTDFNFGPDSAKPTTEEIFDQMASYFQDDASYILDYIIPVPGFENVNEILFDASEEIVPAPAP